MATQVILLEKIEKLGSMGEVVNVKPGYARNYLLPQSKALRATKDNIAYFEAQKSTLEKANNEKKKAAAAVAKKLEGLKVSMIRQASEGGQLYGSVTSRDIAEAVEEQSKEKIERSMVTLNQNFKMIGLFPVEVALHPEVKVEVTVNIARSADEAATQAKTGKALISDDSAYEEEVQAEKEAADAREGLMDDEALEAQKAREAEEAEKLAEEEAKTEEKSAARAEKKAAKAEIEAEEAAAAEAEAEENGEAVAEEAEEKVE